MLALKLISRGRVNVRRLASVKLEYRYAAEAYRLLIEEKHRTLGVVLDWTE